MSEKTTSNTLHKTYQNQSRNREAAYRWNVTDKEFLNNSLKHRKKKIKSEQEKMLRNKSKTDAVYENENYCIIVFRLVNMLNAHSKRIIFVK